MRYCIILLIHIQIVAIKDWGLNADFTDISTVKGTIHKSQKCLVNGSKNQFFKTHLLVKYHHHTQYDFEVVNNSISTTSSKVTS